MTNKVIIIGEHPIANDLVQQYEEKGVIVVRQKTLSADGININDFDELCLLANDGNDGKL